MIGAIKWIMILNVYAYILIANLKPGDMHAHIYLSGTLNVHILYSINSIIAPVVGVLPCVVETASTPVKFNEVFHVNICSLLMFKVVLLATVNYR